MSKSDKVAYSAPAIPVIVGEVKQSEAVAYIGSGSDGIAFYTSSAG